MQIHCDVCGREIDKDAARVLTAPDGEIFYYCGEECLAVKGSLSVADDPAQGEDSSGPSTI